MKPIKLAILFLIISIARLGTAEGSVVKPMDSQVVAGKTCDERHGLAGLSPSAQPVVSATLGRDDPSYHVTQAGKLLRVENHAQAFRAHFSSKGMEVGTDQQHWRLMLRGYGYGGQLQSTPAVDPQYEGNRVEYRRGSVVEWYVNGPLGLEQGFTLMQPPQSKRGSDNEPLTLALALDGDLQAVPDPTENGETAGRPPGLTLRNANGRVVLRYTDLTAYDARGRRLAAWVEVTENELRLRVADADAQYPVVVDPLVEQAVLPPDYAGDHDQYGYSVSVSGNGKTIVVGAPATYHGANPGSCVHRFPGSGSQLLRQ
jgi:hypothetical protein